MSASSGVSLNAPLCDFVRGVRRARVITMSSGFFCVLDRVLLLGVWWSGGSWLTFDRLGIEGEKSGRPDCSGVALPS